VTLPQPRIALLVLCLLCAGCASPWAFVAPDAKAASDPLVTVTCDSERTHTILTNLNPRVVITEVDGRFTYSPLRIFVGQRDYPEIAQLRPGRHNLDLRYVHNNTYADGSLWFDAEAGKTYRVRFKLEGYGVSFWVEEEGTGKAVGGIPGSEPDTQKPPPRPAPTEG